MTEIAHVRKCRKCSTVLAPDDDRCDACGFLNVNADELLEKLRSDARQIAGTLNLCADAGLGIAAILPELVSVMTEQGVQVDLGMIGRVTSLFGGGS